MIHRIQYVPGQTLRQFERIFGVKFPDEGSACPDMNTAPPIGIDQHRKVLSDEWREMPPPGAPSPIFRKRI